MAGLRIALVFFCSVNNTIPDAEGIRRLQAAVGLYADKKVQKIMVTGGHRNEIRLVWWYYYYLRDYFKIPVEDIIVEDESNSTLSNLSESIPILKKLEEQFGKIEFIYLISNFRHMRRIRYIINRMEDWPYSAKEQPLHPDPKVSPAWLEFVKFFVTCIDPMEKTWLTKGFLKKRAKSDR